MVFLPLFSLYTFMGDEIDISGLTVENGLLQNFPSILGSDTSISPEDTIKVVVILFFSNTNKNSSDYQDVSGSRREGKVVL